MIATISKVWPGHPWTRVLAKDTADGVTKVCAIWMHDELGPWLASLCDSTKGPLVLTLKPPNHHGEMEIEDAEKMPTEVQA